jgi:phosphate-selective porin
VLWLLDLPPAIIPYGHADSFSSLSTGDYRPYEEGIFGRVKPKRNLNLNTGGFGAFEVAARFSWVDFDEAFAFDQSTGENNGTSPSGSTDIRTPTPVSS